MAKKSKKNVQIVFIIDVDCVVHDTDKTSDVLKADIETGEYAATVEIEMPGGITNNYTIYPSDFRNGSMSMSDMGSGRFSVKMSGEVARELEPEYDQDLIDMLINDPSQVRPMLCDISDSDVNSYYIDGKDGHRISLGSATIEQ